MNSKIAVSLASLTKRVVFSFGKDPFDRFNKKKTESHIPKEKTIENIEEKNSKLKKQPMSRAQKLHMSKLGQDKLKASSSFNKFGKAHEEEKNQKTEQKQQEKISNIQKIERDDKAQPPSQKIVKSSQEEQKVNKMSSEVNQNDNHEHQHQGGAGKGFQRFAKKSKIQVPKQANKYHLKEDSKSIKKEQEKKKPKQSPKITIDFSQTDESQNKTTYILRKPRSSLKNKDSNMFQRQQQQKEPEKQKQIHEQQKEHQLESQFWKLFQQRIQQFARKYKNLKELRYERLNLLKTSENEQPIKNKQKPSEKPAPVDHKKNLIKLVVAGVVLMLLSSNKYFDFKIGKEADPSFLKQALEENNIDQTWVNNIQMPSTNDDHVRGKNIHKFVYIKLNNGDVFYCVSNQEFEAMWMTAVHDHNLQIETQTPDLYHTRAGQVVSKYDHPPKKVTISLNHNDKKSNMVSDVRSILSFLLLYFFIKSIIQASKSQRGKGKGGMTNLFQNEKSYKVKEAINITFKDVVGMQKAKEEIVEFIDFLKHPTKYSKLGARIPKGALLTGPPGTGKTMIAKACAGESKVPFFTISGSQFIEMYVGVGAQRVRNLFKQAKQNAPSIIFIDEIDAVGKKRSGGGYGGGNDERDTTLNQLLVEMDGFDTGTNVIVFAATNQKEVLDAALTRPGRFDRLIEIDLPDLEGRKEIFEVHLRPLVLDKDINPKQYAKRLATLTPGFTGADIKNVCNQAAIIAARNNKQYVSIIDFELATERIIGGVEKKSQLITQETRKIVAYHECGHGVVSWFIKNANPLLKLTIIPRSKGALGFAQYLPNEHQMYTKTKLLDEICVILGGRIAEQIFFGKISTGASDDLNKAYQVAKMLVTQYGFSNKLGWLQYDETQYAKDYSKDVENRIDAEILQIMKECTDKARALVIQKKELIHNLAQKLLEMETVDQNVIEEILGARPFPISKQHQEYIKEKRRMADEVKVHVAAQSEKQNLQKQVKVQMRGGKRSDYLL